MRFNASRCALNGTPAPRLQLCSGDEGARTKPSSAHARKEAEMGYDYMGIVIQETKAAKGVYLLPPVSCGLRVFTYVCFLICGVYESGRITFSVLLSTPRGGLRPVCHPVGCAPHLGRDGFSGYMVQTRNASVLANSGW